MMEPAEWNGNLAARITKAASKQTYYTVRFLVDRDRVEEAFCAYAYFRWVDDYVDTLSPQKTHALTFVKRQEALVECGYQRRWPGALTAEEQMLARLIHSDCAPASGLQSYIRHMMAVMNFDANRRGRLISQAELDQYSNDLAAAVTDALHYFIGHEDSVPRHEARYMPALAAHITHMLRDTVEDVDAGYFNIPREFLERHQLDPCDLGHKAYRQWAASRVALARAYFQAGSEYLAQVPNTRCRLAAYAYMARFQRVLDAIETENFLLRADYSNCKHARSAWKMIRWTLTNSLHAPHQKRGPVITTRRVF